MWSLAQAWLWFIQVPVIGFLWLVVMGATVIMEIGRRFQRARETRDQISN